MLEVLPIKFLSDDDALIFGKLNVALGKLGRSGLPVAAGAVVTPPELHLKTILEKFDFGHKEIFEQSLTLVKKEINSTPVPQILARESRNKHFLFNGKIIKSIKELWLNLLNAWIEQIKQRLWKDGFYAGIAQNLDPQVVIFVRKLKAEGRAYFDPLQDDTVIQVEQGKVHPNDLKKLDEITRAANKKLFIPHEYEWIEDNGIKLIGLKPYTNPDMPAQPMPGMGKKTEETKAISAIKVFLDMSVGRTVEGDVDGVYIASEKIFDLNRPKESFEDLLWKIVEAGMSFPNAPILVKLADKSEGMGKVRGTLRLLHQKSLFEPLCEAILFARHKKDLLNVHVVIPFVRIPQELLQIKRELAVRKLMRKNSLQIWMEAATPENIINLEDYLLAGIDGIVLNLDELASHFSGFDHQEAELAFYKRQVFGLLKFLEDSLKLLHKSKKPFLALGSIALYPEVLDFLVEKGVYGMVVERYEASSAHDLLHQAEGRMILKKSM